MLAMNFSGSLSGAGFFGVVELPEGLDGVDPAQGFNGGFGFTLGGAVIHDGNARRDGVDQRGAGALIPAVVRDDEDVDVANAVIGTQEIHLLVPRQVAEVEDAQFAPCNEDAEGAGVLGLIGGTGFGIFAERIGLAGTGERLLDEIAVRGEDFGVETPGTGSMSPGLATMWLIFSGGKDFLIGVGDGDGGFVAGFAIRAVIDEGSDGDAVDQLRDAAGVIDVVVGEQDVVDAGEAGLFCGGDDAVGIAAIIAGPAGIDGAASGCQE